MSGMREVDVIDYLIRRLETGVETENSAVITMHALLMMRYACVR